MKDMGSYLQCEYERNEFSHAGDLGDIIWGTGALRYWLEQRHQFRATLHLFNLGPERTTHLMTPQRAAMIGALLNEQPWLRVLHSEVEVRSDFNGFRDHQRNHATIGGWHLSALGFTNNGAFSAAFERPWLTVPPPPAPISDKVQAVFVRTHRYRSHDFPWSSFIDWFGDRAVFLGHGHEYETFIADHPRAARIPHLVTSDLLQAAQIIAHAKLFVSNQTSLFAVAEALKKPRVLEVFSPMPNCHYGSRNCLAVHPGMIVRPERVLDLLDAPYTV